MSTGKNNAAYKEIKKKMLIQILLMPVGAVFLLILLYSVVFSGRVADAVVAVINWIPFVDYGTATRIYNAVFRQNVDFWMLIGVILIVLPLFWLALSQYGRYFNQIADGVDQLGADTTREITLSPELYDMEKKLNALRETLNTRAMEAKLAEQRKNDLVMYLAHDIRTPLTSVIGYLSLLDEAPDMPAEQRAKYLHITLDKALRLETLVNEFFEITRYNMQEMPLEREKIDLSYMLVQLVDEFYPILQQKQNTAVLHADENLTVSGDAVKLARVFNNLLKNAVAYSDPGTPITISAGLRAGADGKKMVAVTVRDQGATIPAEKLDRLFEKFYRLDTARNSQTGGSGLGLSIAKQIVLQHGGQIRAESADNTVVFTVELPAGN